MSNIKELTMEHHRAAERCGFVKTLLGGNISDALYATFLWNQSLKYTELERIALENNLFDGIESVLRAKHINADFKELWKNKFEPMTFGSTLDYIDHINSLTNKDDIFAHIYVHHMGDLSGGQIIKNRVPGNGRMYVFDGDVELLKNEIRSRTTDEMATEAGICFQFAIRQFQDLEKLSISVTA